MDPGAGGHTIVPRRLAAILLVLALTGSALAVTQQRLYTNDEAQAQDLVAVQQHTTFVEIVVQEEEKRNESQIHEFAAVVGLIKKCERVVRENTFDNAVLWFNDQFLFGDKANTTAASNRTPDDALGYNGDNNTLLKRDGTTDRWAGCYIPDGFATAIGADDPFGTGRYLTEANTSQAGGSQGIEDNVDLVQRLIDLDNRCRGCIFEYQSSFFVNDPNIAGSSQDVRWIVDKLVYPVSVLGNLFQEGRDNALREDGCASGNGATPFSDPRDNHPHQDECRGDDGPSNHECTDDDGDCRYPNNRAGNHTENATRDDHEHNTTLVEPLYTVHLQVNPLTPGPRGYLDQAPWQYPDSTVVDGMPYSQDPDDEGYEDCKTDQFNASIECSIEYNFLLAVDFPAFDDRRAIAGEDEIREDDVRHGEGVFPQPPAWQGNSHPHNPQTLDAGPDHRHDTVSLDVFFHEQAPHFVTQHPYWDDHGRPPAVNADCSSTASGSDANATRQSAVEVRSPIVCDTTKDSAYHAHDGSQTPSDG